MSYWDKSKVELLKKYWASGISAQAIAEKLGEGATRNSVIGKSHRLMLQARAVSKKSSTKVNTENNKSEVKTQKLGRKGKFKALLLNPNFPPEQPTRLENLSDSTCRYPLGEKMEPAEFFCGRKPADKWPYCELHILFSYVSKNEKEEDAIEEEDIPKFIIEKKIKSA